MPPAPGQTPCDESWRENEDLPTRVDPRDTVVFAGVVATLAAVGLIASLLPARRVTRIEPLQALVAD